MREDGGNGNIKVGLRRFRDCRHIGKNVGPEDYVVYAYTDSEKTLMVLSFSAQQKYGLITKEQVCFMLLTKTAVRSDLLEKV